MALLGAQRPKSRQSCSRFPRGFAYSIGQGDLAAFTSILMRLSDDYPSIAYSLARCRLDSGYDCDKVVRPVAEGLVSQMQPMPIREGVRRASDACRRLVGITQAEMEDAVVAFVARLEGKGRPTQPQNFYLRPLGETVDGRRFLSAALLLRLLDRRAL